LTCWNLAYCGLPRNTAGSWKRGRFSPTIIISSLTRCPERLSLGDFIKRLHGETAHELNRLHGEDGRSVWYNFWDTALTYEKSYLARLNYVHQNPVKHGLVAVANSYSWCSAAWFERTATLAQVETIYRFKIDQVQVIDDF
jgi:putative transposase